MLKSPLVPGKSGMAPLSGLDIYYAQYGQGPHLVLVPGLGVSTWIWDDHLPHFAPFFTVTTFDLRGAGRSDKPEGPYTVSQMAGDLLELLDFLNIPQCHLLGISLGGFVAQEFAIGHPERVNRLVLAATGPGGEAHSPMMPEVMDLLLAKSAAQSPGELLRRKLLLAFTENYMDSPAGEGQIRKRIRDPQPRAAFEAQAAAGSVFDRCRDLGNISAPTLILSGALDPLVPPDNGRYLQEHIPDSRFSLFEGLRHQFFVEDAQRFCEEVTAFLQGE